MVVVQVVVDGLCDGVCDSVGDDAGDDHDRIKEPIANKEKKFKSNDPKEAPNVTTQNLFSIFNSNSKFTNTPGSKVRKRAKPRTKKPTVSNTKYKTIFNFFNLNIGKEDDS